MPYCPDEGVQSFKDSQIQKRPKRVQPCPPLISLNEPARLRREHLLFLFGIKSGTTLRKRIGLGLIPLPDGHDGRPYWNTWTVRDFLQGSAGVSNVNAL